MRWSSQTMLPASPPMLVLTHHLILQLMLSIVRKHRAQLPRGRHRCRRIHRHHHRHCHGYSRQLMLCSKPRPRPCTRPLLNYRRLLLTPKEPRWKGTPTSVTQRLHQRRRSALHLARRHRQNISAGSLKFSTSQTRKRRSQARHLPHLTRRRRRRQCRPSGRGPRL